MDVFTRRRTQLNEYFEPRREHVTQETNLEVNDSDATSNTAIL